MKLGIQINEGPYNHEASVTALNYCKAAIAAGHEIFRVFFYHDGVNNGTRYTTPPQDDINLVNSWSELAKEHNLDLVVCVAAAQRRGIVDQGEQDLRAHLWLPGLAIKVRGNITCLIQRNSCM